MDALDIAITIGFGLGGLLVGWTYFLLMHYSLLHLGRKKIAITQFVVFAFLRMVLFGGGLAGAFLVGSWPLIAYVIGFVVARTVAVTRARTSVEFSPPEAENKKNHG
jgi:hypothetical protein